MSKSSSSNRCCPQNANKSQHFELCSSRIKTPPKLPSTTLNRSMRTRKWSWLTPCAIWETSLESSSRMLRHSQVSFGNLKKEKQKIKRNCFRPSCDVCRTLRRIRDTSRWLDEPIVSCRRWKEDTESSPSTCCSTKTCTYSEARRVRNGSVRKQKGNFCSRNLKFVALFTVKFVTPMSVVNRPNVGQENQPSPGPHPDAPPTILTSSNRSWACSENFWPSFTLFWTCNHVPGSMNLVWWKKSLFVFLEKLTELEKLKKKSPLALNLVKFTF